MGEFSAYTMAKKAFEGLTGQLKPVDPYERGVPVFSMNDVSSNVPLPSRYGETLIWGNDPVKIEPPPKVNIQNINSYVNASNKNFQNINDIMSKIVPPPPIYAPLIIDFENIKQSLNKIKIKEQETQQQQALNIFHKVLIYLNLPNNFKLFKRKRMHISTPCQILKSVYLLNKKNHQI